MSYQKRTRKRHIPDWYDQSKAWRYRRDRYYPWPFSPVKTTTEWSGRPSLATNAVRGLQTTVDENHSRRPPFKVIDGDIGGEFYMERTGVSVSNPEAQHLYHTRIGSDEKIVGDYLGPLFALSPDQVSKPAWSLENLNPLGTTAIARCKPTNNVADASVFLGELYREKLPNLLGVSFWKDRTNVARGAGSEYLNSEFGWKPLVGSVQDFARAVAQAHTILSQYERDSGRVVRRQYEFPVVRTETTVLEGPTDGTCYAPNFDPILDVSDPLGRPNRYRVDRVFKRTWFSGAFSYHLPVGYKSRNAMVRYASQAGPLLGLELTPSTLWNLAPWSWAIDWFSNTGDVISNLTDWATDGLVMKYGYIMQHELRESTWYLAGNTRWRPRTVQPSTVTAYREIKRRQKASPFGFGVSWNSFSPRQIAIAIALGLTRS